MRCLRLTIRSSSSSLDWTRKMLCCILLQDIVLISHFHFLPFQLRLIEKKWICGLWRVVIDPWRKQHFQTAARWTEWNEFRANFPQMGNSVACLRTHLQSQRTVKAQSAVKKCQMALSKCQKIATCKSKHTIFWLFCLLWRCLQSTE